MIVSHADILRAWEGASTRHIQAKGTCEPEAG